MFLKKLISYVTLKCFYIFFVFFSGLVELYVARAPVLDDEEEQEQTPVEEPPLQDLPEIKTTMVIFRVIFYIFLCRFLCYLSC